MTVIQRTPNLGIGIRMQRVPAASSASTQDPGGGDGGGSALVFLLPDLIPMSPEYYYDPETGDPLRMGSGLWWGQVMRPAFAGSWRVVGGYVDIQPPTADGDGIVTLRAIAVGAAGVSWTWSLDTPPFPDGGYATYWDGVSITVQDGTLRIRVLPGEQMVWTDPWWATLTCIASVGGTEVGRIVLRPGWNLYDVAALPVPE